MLDGVITAIHRSNDPEPPSEDSAVGNEDLAALLTRVLETLGRSQKELAERAGIPYPTLNAWVNRTRGTSRISPETLRSIVAAIRHFGGEVTPKQVFEAAGRRVPGPTDEEREARLLRAFRQLSVTGQRAVIHTAEAIAQESRAS